MDEMISQPLTSAELEQRLTQAVARLRRGNARYRVLKQRLRQLQETNADLEAFASAVSHDLRAPLRALQGFASILVQDYNGVLDSTGREYLERLITTAERMDTMIQELLIYGQMNRAELRLHPVDLNQVVSRVLTQLENEFHARKARVMVEVPLPKVTGNRTILVQVVANLLSNAVKFIPPGTRPQVRLWAEETGSRVRLWVEDNGIGIEPQHQQRIFRVFERLHGIETYPGTGIGLAIVRRGIERLGGQVGVESTPGQGSKFWVELLPVKEKYE